MLVVASTHENSGGPAIAAAIRRLVLPVILLLGLVGCRDVPSEAPLPPERALTSLHETGFIVAANNVEVTSPNWGSSHRITWLIPEGTLVAAGDTVLTFETSEIATYYDQNAAELTVLTKAVDAALAQQGANATSTANAIAKARLAREKAVLEAEQRRFESDLVKHQAELDRRQAEIDLSQALRDSAGQARVDSLEVAQARLKLVKQQARVRRYRTYVDDMAATAPSAGMVVYHRDYTEEGIESSRAGDEVSRSTPVLEITDTSVMKVQFSVHEQDRWRIRTGQPVAVVLDAFTEVRFTGTIEKVSSLPQERLEGRIAQRFEVVAVIDDRDERLKPGMSARVIIELGGLP